MYICRERNIYIFIKYYEQKRLYLGCVVGGVPSYPSIGMCDSSADAVISLGQFLIGYI